MRPGRCRRRCRRIRIAECDQLLRVANRQIAKQDLVDQGKDGGIAADAERQREQRDRGEAGTLGKRAHTDAKVLQNSFSSRFPARRPDLVLDGIAAAEFHAGRTAGFLSRHAVALFVGRGGLKIALQLFVELTFDTLPAEKAM